MSGSPVGAGSDGSALPVFAAAMRSRFGDRARSVAAAQVEGARRHGLSSLEPWLAVARALDD